MESSQNLQNSLGCGKKIYSGICGVANAWGKRE